MSRPSDWSVVGLASDPVPGDPVVVRQEGLRYGQAAERLARIAATMRALDAGDSHSMASVEALANQTRTAITQVEAIQARQQALRDALVPYAQAHAQAQHDTLTARALAATASQDAADEHTRAARFDRLASKLSSSDPVEADGYRRLASNARDAEQSAKNRVASQKRVVDSVVQIWGRAARQAIEVIEAVTETDGLNDTWWDRWGAGLVAAIAGFAEKLAMIAGILALVFCWVPGLGQFLMAVAAIAGAVAAIANIVLAATGEKSWGEAIISIAFAALGFLGLGGLKGIFSAITGIGKALKGFSAATKGLAAAAKTLAGTASTKMAGFFKSLFKGLGGKNLPVVTFSRSRAPGIAANFDTATRQGAPTVLQRTSSAAAKSNRANALKGVPSRRLAGMSWDEFPFASTTQGGGVLGKTLFRRLVPNSEQWYQGGKLNSFYQKFNIQVGDWFRVKFVP